MMESYYGNGGSMKGGRQMKDLLKNFVGKTLRIYTISGVESYLSVLDEVGEDYLVLRGVFSKEKTYLAIQYIESFKVQANTA
jgi:ferredoxin-fold anticodon binding domain-containing protein